MERMGSLKEKEKKSFILKTLERCKTLGNKRNSRRTSRISKTKSWPQMAPVGYITVYVGSDKERFLIWTESVNHPLFKVLLDEAEREYGYAREGPIELPCEVDRFDRVLSEIDEYEESAASSPSCSFPPTPMRGFGKGSSGYRILSPSRLVITGGI